MLAHSETAAHHQCSHAAVATVVRYKRRKYLTDAPIADRGTVVRKHYSATIIYTSGSRPFLTQRPFLSHHPTPNENRGEIFISIWIDINQFKRN